MLEIAKMLYLRFSCIYGHLFVKDHVTDEFVEMWWHDWAEGLAGIDLAHVKYAVDYCRLNVKWPPSLCEFLEICESASGLPSAHECMRLAISRDFSHPIVKNIFDKIGSWNMQHDSEIELTRKFNAHYPQELAKLRLKKQHNALFLEQDKKEVSHGSDETGQRNNKATNNLRENGMRKVEGYLF